MIAPFRRPLRVKLILPALTEATSPYWRPIKYSLFPPLGLATIAAYLDPEDEAEIVDEHVMPLDTDDAPDLVLIQVYITNAYRIAGAPQPVGFVLPKCRPSCGPASWTRAQLVLSPAKGHSPRRALRPH
jgi:hypothetical protein